MPTQSPGSSPEFKPQGVRQGVAGRGREFNWMRPESLLLLVLGMYAFNSFEMGRESAAAQTFQTGVQLAFLGIAFFISRSWAHPRGLLIGFVAAAFILLLNMFSLRAYAIVAVVSIFATLAVAGIYAEDRRRYFASLIGVLLIVHVAGLCFQAAAYFASGAVIDIHQMIFPASKARVGYQLGTLRWSGFFIEPGTYSHWVFLLVFLRSFLLKRVTDPISAVAVASFVLTLSAWGLIAALLYGIAVGVALLLERIPKGPGRLAILGMAGLICLLLVGAQQQGMRSLLPAPVAARMNVQDGTYLGRVVAGAMFRQRLHEVIIVGKPISDRFCAQCRSIQDLGVWSMTIFHFGLVPALLLGLLFLWGTYRVLGPPGLILSVPLMLSKINFYDPLLWLVIGAALAALPVVGRSVIGHRATRARVAPQPEAALSPPAT